MMHDIISSFNGGEFSPYVASRTSLDKYRSGCRTLENFLITPYGPINRRPGTQFMGAAKTSATRCRLFGLNLSDKNKIVMELGVGYVRFWQGGLLQKFSVAQTWNGVSYDAGNIVEAIGITDTSTATAPVFASGSPHPYQEADLRGINVCQINNVVYLTHPNYPPMRLSYWASTPDYWTSSPANPPWTLGPIAWKWAPMLDQNYTSTTITPSATSGNIILSASAPLWGPSHVGSYWEISHPNPSGASNLPLSASGNSASIQVQGAWALQTFGTWFGTIYLDQSLDGGTTWSTIRSYYSNGDYNPTDNGTATGVGGGYQILPYFRIRFVVGSGSPSYSPRCMFQVINPTLSGFVKITGFTDNQNVSASVVAPIINTSATALWREGAFSPSQGYPNAVVLHDSRIVFGGTSLSPGKVWGSYVGDFENFKQGANASDSYAFALASQSGGRIQWMASKIALLIGTTTDEWYISSTSQGSPITPGSVYAQKQSHYGSAPFPAFIVNDTTLYVQRMGRKIREFIYTWQSQTWVSNDLTALAQHISLQGITELAYQRVPDAILWFIRGDGTLCALTYEREQQVSGFSRMMTNPENGDIFESVCTINSTAGEDELWVLVNRQIGGVASRCIERFATGQRDALDSINYSSYWYLDAAKRYSFGSPTSTLTGLDHLNGQKVAVWGDGAVVPISVATPIVSGGSITLQTPVSNCVVGLPYTSLVIPETLNRDMQDGTSAGRRMRITSLNVRLYNSFGGESSSDGLTWYPMKIRAVGDLMDTSPVAYDGYRRVSVASNWRDGADLYLRSSLPAPFTVAAVVGKWESTEQGQ
jgi:hypothetical protein